MLSSPEAWSKTSGVCQVCAASANPQIRQFTFSVTNDFVPSLLLLYCFCVECTLCAFLWCHKKEIKLISEATHECHRMHFIFHFRDMKMKLRLLAKLPQRREKIWNRDFSNDPKENLDEILFSINNSTD